MRFSSTANAVAVISQAAHSGTIQKPSTKLTLIGILVLCLLAPWTAVAHPGHSYPSAELAAQLASAEPGRLPADEAQLKAWPDLSWPPPHTQIRLHVIRTANDDGSEASPMTEAHFSNRLPTINQIYAPAGIEFLFNPATDFQFIQDTLLNKTFSIDVNPNDYPNPNMEPPTETASFKAARRALADQYRGKLVIFMADEDQLWYDEDAGYWRVSTDVWSASSHNERYVSMVQAPAANVFAHELGHYLHLVHPFASDLETVQEAEDKITDRLALDLTVAEGLTALDGDYPYVTDTAADAGTAVWSDYFGAGQACAGDDSTSIPLTVSLPWGGTQAYTLQPQRRLLMSYFNCGPFIFSPQQYLRMKDSVDVLNRHDLVSEAPTPDTYLDRRGSAYAGAIVDVEAVRVGTGRIATAILASNSMMKVIPWDVSESGTVTRAGSGAYAGPVSEIAAASMGLGNLVTAVRNGSGNLQIITWKVHDDGTVERLSDATDVAIKKVKIARFDMLNVVTAVQLPNNDLKVIAWQLDADGRIRRLADAEAGEVDGFDVSASWLGATTSVRDGSGNLKVINWTVRKQGDTWFVNRKGSAVIAPTTSTLVATGMDIPSHGATAYTDAFDWLKVSSWAGDYDGNVSPVSTYHVGAKCTEIASERLGTELLAVGCRATGNSNLLMTLLDIGPGGQGIQLLDHQFVGGISALSLARAHQDVVVTAVRNGAGNLQLIAWKRSEPTFQF